MFIPFLLVAPRPATLVEAGPGLTAATLAKLFCPSSLNKHVYLEYKPSVWTIRFLPGHPAKESRRLSLECLPRKLPAKQASLESTLREFSCRAPLECLP